MKKNIKLIDYGMKFLNSEIINNYMSPELFRKQINKKVENIDEMQCEIFSIGVIILKSIN